MNFLINPVIHPFLQILITFILCSGILKLGNIINVKIFKNYNYYFLNFAIASILISQTLCSSLVFGIFKETVIVFSISLFVLGIINFAFFKEIKTLLNLLFNNNYKLLSYHSTTREDYIFNGRITELISSNKLFNDLKINSISSDDRFMFCGSMGLNNDLKKIMIENNFHEGANNYPGEFVLEKAFVD